MMRLIVTHFISFAAYVFRPSGVPSFPHIKDIMCYKLKESRAGRAFAEQDE